jgi:hypothetical protein
MSTSPIQPDATETDDLVAYLDGELSAEECRRVERRLASDADYRRRLTELEQAWTALDALPPTVVNDDFARTTIEMVCVAAESDGKQASSVRAATGRRRRLAMVALGAAIALAAFAATWFLAPSRDRDLVMDLPVVAQLDVLSDVGDLKFLRGLTKLDLESATRSTTTDVAAVKPTEWETNIDRGAWIESLSAGEKAELAGKLERFEREPPQTRERLRQLAREIETAKDHEQLNATLASYGVWLQSRTPAERAGLRALPNDARLKKVEQLVAQSQRSMRRQLSIDDEKALQEAILSLVEERRHELIDEVRQRGNPKPEERIGEPSVAIVAWTILGREMQSDRRREQLENRLTASLSEEAQAYLDQLEGWRRQQQLGRWVFEALRPKFGPQNLEEFFANSLTDDQREYLLGLPRAEMDERLQQMYARSQVGLRDDGVPGRPWWGRPGERGGRDRNGKHDRDARGGRGRDEGDRFDGPPREFGGRRFDGPPPGGRRGPGGPGGPGRPDGPPPFGPPPRDGERPYGPPPGEGEPPPENRPPVEQPI